MSAQHFRVEHDVKCYFVKTYILRRDDLHNLIHRFVHHTNDSRINVSSLGSVASNWNVRRHFKRATLASRWDNVETQRIVGSLQMIKMMMTTVGCDTPEKGI